MNIDNSYKIVCKDCGRQFSYPAQNSEFENHKCGQTISNQISKEEFKLFVTLQSSGMSIVSREFTDKVGVSKQKYFDIMEHYTELEECYGGA